MRYIKFRAYDNERNCFIYSDFQGDDYCFDFDSYGILCCYKSVIVEHQNEPPELGEEEIRNIQQCTGLKDKNGKEIYEGDIVRLQGISPTHGQLFEKIIQVIFVEGAFYPFGMMGFNGFKETDYEIIGNIYENQELLAGEKQ